MATVHITGEQFLISATLLTGRDVNGQGSKLGDPATLIKCITKVLNIEHYRKHNKAAVMVVQGVAEYSNRYDRGSHDDP